MKRYCDVMFALFMSSQAQMAAGLPHRHIPQRIQSLCEFLPRENLWGVSYGDDFFTNEAQIDHVWTLIFFEMADHGIPHHRVEFVERICDGEDSMADRTSGVATFRRLLNKEDNFAQFLRHLERFCRRCSGWACPATPSSQSENALSAAFRLRPNPGIACPANAAYRHSPSRKECSPSNGDKALRAACIFSSFSAFAIKLLSFE